MMRAISAASASRSSRRGNAFAKAALGDVGGDAGGGVDAHVGADQQFFKAFQHRVVEQAARFVAAANQAADQAGFGLGLGRGR